jgi:ATP-binding cassette subfamily F protein 2
LSPRRHSHRSAEILDFSLNAIDFMRREFPELNLDVTDWRGRLGMYGITGKTQTKLIGCLSDGQKSSLVFCWLAQKSPQMLLFDEPTNHLDMESIEALADAINSFQGGMVLVSHDFRLLQVRFQKHHRLYLF